MKRLAWNQQMPSALASVGRRVAVLLASMSLTAGCRTSATEVLDGVRPIVAAAKPREISVAYEALPGKSAFVDADVVMHAASTMKIAVLIEVLRRSERGTISLDAGVPVVNRFKSVVDGSEFALDPADDEDPSLYEHLGQDVPVRELARRMIVRSSNLATNLLLERVTPVAVQATIESLGTRNMRVVRCLEDAKAFDKGITNVTTARDLATLLRAIAERTAFRDPATQQIAFDLLGAQEFNDMIPAGVPPGTRVMHKTGDITRIRHDAAIVVPAVGAKTPYVLVVLTRGFDDPKEATEAVVQVSRAVWAAHARSIGVSEAPTPARSP
jgi:beta-lactamase class A